MKVVRIIKVIALVTAIICALVPCVGNFFIIRDACTYKAQISADDIHAELDEYPLGFKDLFSFGAKAEESENVTEPNEGEEDGLTEEFELDNETDNEFADFEEGQDDTEKEALNADEVTETGDEPAQQEENDTQEQIDETVEDGEYNLSKHANIVIGFMKAANAKTELSFLNKLNKGENRELHFRKDAENESFKINTWLMISFIALTVAFILHLISKKTKTVLGILLMVFGYIIFIAFFAIGQYTANLDENSIYNYTNVSGWRLWNTVGYTAAACILGLGFVRCGSLRSSNSALKRKVTKLQSDKKKLERELAKGSGTKKGKNGSIIGE